LGLLSAATRAAPKRDLRHATLSNTNGHSG
jgi:hypothetical protein